MPIHSIFPLSMDIEKRDTGLYRLGMGRWHTNKTLGFGGVSHVAQISAGRWGAASVEDKEGGCLRS